MGLAGLGGHPEPSLESELSEGALEDLRAVDACFFPSRGQK